MGSNYFLCFYWFLLVQQAHFHFQVLSCYMLDAVSPKELEKWIKITFSIGSCSQANSEKSFERTKMVYIMHN